MCRLKVIQLAIVSVLFLGAAFSTAAMTKPNVVLFLADDMGFADCGVYNCTDILTPHIDSLAHNGVRFTNGYTSGCVCSPTRAGLISCRYQQRLGFDANAEGKARPGTVDRGPRALDINQITFPQRMKALGYATGMVGKWHIGSGDGYRPNQRGFDFFYGIMPHGLGAKGPHGETPPPTYRDEVAVATPPNHMETFCDESLKFIDDNRDKPFLLYMAFTAVHGPFVAPEPWFSRQESSLPAARRRYAADMAQLDKVVGRVMQRLRERGLEENTLVFFLSDNGGPGGAVNNGALRGTKWTVWEGGIHVPFIAYWKGRFEAGRVLDQPVIQLDIPATAFAAAGAEVAPDWNIDGANLLPLLEGKSDAAPHEALFWRFGVQYAVRQGDWKLVKPHINMAPRLHNLAQDIGEQNDLAAQHPERVKQLQELWDKWNAKNEPPRWIDQRWNGDGAKFIRKNRRKAVKKPAVSAPDSWLEPVQLSGSWDRVAVALCFRRRVRVQPAMRPRRLLCRVRYGCSQSRQAILHYRFALRSAIPR